MVVPPVFSKYGKHERPMLQKIEMSRDTTAWRICLPCSSLTTLLVLDPQSESIQVEEMTASKSYLTFMLRDTHLIAVH